MVAHAGAWRTSIAARYWLATRMAVWLCELPVLLPVLPLPALLRRITSRASHQTPAEGALPPDVVADVAVHVCRLPMFRVRPFPRACLRQSLVLFRALTTMGYPATIHFGVRKEGQAVEGHSWVTLYGRPVAESGSVDAFAALYSFERDTETDAARRTS
jgi:hypothetical protein